MKLLILLALFASCSKIQIKTPASRFMSPEVKGKLLSGAIQFEGQTATEAELDLTDNKTDNPLLLRNNVTHLANSIDVGIVDKVDFIMKSHVGAPTTYGAKVQVLGSSQKDASMGNKALAVTVMYGVSETTGIDNGDGNVLTTDDNNLSADIEQTVMDFSVIYGQRVQEDILIYGSVQFSQNDFKATLESLNSSTLDGEKVELSTAAYGVGLGAIRYWEKYYANLELSTQTTSWDNNESTTYAFASVAIGYKWD